MGRAKARLTAVEFDCLAAVHRFIYAVCSQEDGRDEAVSIDIPYAGEGLDEAARASAQSLAGRLGISPAEVAIDPGMSL